MDLTAILAIWGALTGTLGTAGYIYTLLRDRQDVRVRAYLGMLGGRFGPAGLCVLVEAANLGRRPVTLTSVGFDLTDESGFVFTVTDLPQELTEGKSHTEWVKLSAMADELARQHPLPLPKTAWYRDATGQLWSGKAPEDLVKAIQEEVSKRTP